MLIEFINPLLTWLGIGLVPFLIIVLILVLVLKG